MRVTAHGISRLKQDHGRLRAALGVMEFALERPVQRETWDVMRAACGALASRLQQHLRRETHLVASCHTSIRILGTRELAKFAVEHHRLQELVRVLKRCLAKDQGRCAVDDLRPLLGELISGLRRQMQEQEEELYPFIMQVCRRVEAGASQAGAVPPPPQAAVASSVV